MAQKLEALAELLYRDLDLVIVHLGEGLQEILKPPKPQKPPKPLPTPKPCAKFFEEYESNGRKINSQSINKLAELASRFPAGKEAEKSLDDFVQRYRERPRWFWDLFSSATLEDSSDQAVISYLLESSTKHDSLDPTRRRIVSSILYDKVQSERARLENEFGGKQLKKSETRKSLAYSKILDNTCNTSDPDRRDEFLQRIRIGARWAKHEPGTLIGLAGSTDWTL